MSVQSISKARVDLLLEHPFYGSLLMRLHPKETPELPTTATDGTYLYFNKEYVAARTSAELKALLAHEVMHCCMGHLWRRDGRQPMLWNVACDIAINQILRDSGFQLPPTGLEPEEKKYPFWAAEDIYADLIRRSEKQKSQAIAMACNGMKDPQKSDGEGEGGGEEEGEEGQSHGVSEGIKPQSESDWKIAIEIDVKSSQQGTVPQAIKRLMENMHETKVDWRTVLRRFVARVTPSDYSWVEPNRRFIGQGVYLPGITKDGTPRLGLIVDTSGSIGGDILSEFASEMTAILEECKPEVLEVVFADAAVANTVEYTPGEMIDLEHDASGGGGTDFNPGIDYFKDHPAGPPVAVIYLTDGYASRVSEEPPFPVLWGITANGRNTQTFGEEISLN
jgi:predicted metal-dependent peptidase